MNERIEAIRAQNNAPTTTNHAPLHNNRNEQWLEVARGLSVLQKLLVNAGVEPEGWATYTSGSNGTFQHTGERASDGNSEIYHEKGSSFWGRRKDPYWYLGSWETHSTGYVESVYRQHNYITQSGKVIAGHEASHPFVDLSRVHTPEDAQRLVTLGPTNRLPPSVVGQIAWTAARYGLVWPKDGPEFRNVK